MFWTGFVIGMFLGVVTGLFTAGLCAMAARRDKRLEPRSVQTPYPRAEEPCGEHCLSTSV